jgi:hypothetical protein
MYGQVSGSELVRAMVRAGCTAELFFHATQELVKSVNEEAMEGEMIRLIKTKKTVVSNPLQYVDGESNTSSTTQNVPPHRLRINFEPSGMGTASPSRVCLATDGDGGSSNDQDSYCGIDCGKTFPGNSRNGFEYGWSSSVSDMTRDRSNSSRSHRRR